MIHSIQRDQKQGHCTYLSILVYNKLLPSLAEVQFKKKKREINKHKYENFLAFSHQQSPLSESHAKPPSLFISIIIHIINIIISSTKLNTLTSPFPGISFQMLKHKCLTLCFLPLACLHCFSHLYSIKGDKTIKYIIKTNCKPLLLQDLTPATLSETNVLYQNQSHSSKKSLQGRGSCKDPVVHAGLSLRAAADALIHASTYASPSSTNTLYQAFIPFPSLHSSIIVVNERSSQPQKVRSWLR